MIRSASRIADTSGVVTISTVCCCDRILKSLFDSCWAVKKWYSQIHFSSSLVLTSVLVLRMSYLLSVQMAVRKDLDISCLLIIACLILQFPSTTLNQIINDSILKPHDNVQITKSDIRNRSIRLSFLPSLILFLHWQWLLSFPTPLSRCDYDNFTHFCFLHSLYYDFI